MNFKQLVFGATVLATFAAVADLTVSGWSQNATSGLVTVNYTLTDSETKIVTLDVATNGVSDESTLSAAHPQTGPGTEATYPS